MNTDGSATAPRAALTGTLFYSMGAAGAQRVPAPRVDVAPALAREQGRGDRLAISGVGRWLSDTAQRLDDDAVARGTALGRAALEAGVQSAFLAQGGEALASMPQYGPGGPNDRRRRSPYAGSADAALLDFTAARAARTARGAGQAGSADAIFAEADGGFSVYRGWDSTRVSGAALELLAIYGDAAGAARAA